jgi:hypothetical protein
LKSDDKFPESPTSSPRGDATSSVIEVWRSFYALCGRLIVDIGRALLRRTDSSPVSHHHFRGWHPWFHATANPRMDWQRRGAKVSSFIPKDLLQENKESVAGEHVFYGVRAERAWVCYDTIKIYVTELAHLSVRKPMHELWRLNGVGLG